MFLLSSLLATIKAYRDVFTLLLRFCRDAQGIAPEKLRLEHIDVSLVEAFLDHLETERKSSNRGGRGVRSPADNM